MNGIDRDRIKGLVGEGIEIAVLDMPDSTSNEARRRALEVSCPCVFIADGQTAGRGRCGRAFYSPKGKGLYLSLLLKNDGSAFSPLLLTSAAAVAVRQAILEKTGIATDIKWVNDLYLNEKKVAGLLCESFCSEGSSYTAIGVGINLYEQEFPTELSSIAGYIGATDRNELAAAIILELLRIYKAPDRRVFLEEYRRYSCVLGKEIIYIQNGAAHTGRAAEINDNGALRVETENGSVLLQSGEISLRLKNDITRGKK